VCHDTNVGYRAQKIPFSGKHGPEKHFDIVSDTSLLFFDEIITLIVQETNRYAEKVIQGCTLKPRSCIRNWEPVTGDEI
jgi:hypothetical protein